MWRLGVYRAVGRASWLWIFFVRLTFICVNLNNVPFDITIMHPKK